MKLATSKIPSKIRTATNGIKPCWAITGVSKVKMAVVRIPAPYNLAAPIRGASQPPGNCVMMYP